ncbi:glyoxalase [Pokkaliibacter plantistimulans]|uniref:Glyoxalase n=1 Tax=Pokkaliibacter plantistimulans TaxID=1635171 RepID=A0ABX5LR15_9GAMM|nr:VOC family protein [Pokkaliibacter plantistimulans]PXF29110.1 glyoxalase [Pokkaliibacter plantistimulans]
MSSPLIEGLRSVAFDVPDLALAETFYTQVWHLDVVDRTATTLYLSGTGKDHHLLALHQAERLAIRDVVLRARSASALNDIAAQATVHGGKVLSAPAVSLQPSGGQEVVIADPHGRIFRVVHGDQQRTEASAQADRPIRLAHAVLNSHDVAASQQFFESVFGFWLADRTRIMAFLNCNTDHHTIAFGDADNDALNHVAFLMSDIDSVMRGGGRMRDAQYPIEWGPGRHGPGNNAFNYFIGPFGEVIEYTAEVEQIDDSYRAGGPEDWSWPAGRVDQWGISQPPSKALKEAQKSVFFIPVNG